MIPVDPYAHDPRRWVGRKITFDAPGHENPLPSKRLAGTVITQTYAGRTLRGQLPDYTLTVEGASGKRLPVSLVESHADFPK